mgnify:CR=1 FL=1
MKFGFNKSQIALAAIAALGMTALTTAPTAASAAKVAGTYATGDAREAGKNSIAKPSNDGIENRREVYEAPEIMDWKEQRKLSMDQSKGILGH